MPDRMLKSLRERFGGRFETLSEPEAQALVTAEVESVVTNARLCEITEQHPADATKILQGLVGEGMLHPEGYGRWTTYRIQSAPMPPIPRPEKWIGEPSLHDELAGSKASHHASIMQAGTSGGRTRSVDDEIVKLLGGRYLTAREIAGELRRDPTDVRTRFLTPLVRSGRIELKHPAAARHPSQAYTAAKRDANEVG